MTSEHNYHWYDLAHLIAFFDHAWFIKIAFFIFACIVYPLSWLIKRSLGENSTNWENVKILTVKLSKLIQKALIICAIIFVIIQFTRYFMGDISN